MQIYEEISNCNSKLSTGYVKSKYNQIFFKKKSSAKKLINKVIFSNVKQYISTSELELLIFELNKEKNKWENLEKLLYANK